MHEVPAALKDMLASGRSLLTDTKSAKKPGPGASAKTPATKSLSAPPETDPFKIFIRKCVDEKRKKTEIVEDIRRIIKTAEEDL